MYWINREDGSLTFLFANFAFQGIMEESVHVDMTKKQQRWRFGWFQRACCRAVQLHLFIALLLNRRMSKKSLLCVILIHAYNFRTTLDTPASLVHNLALKLLDDNLHMTVTHSNLSDPLREGLKSKFNAKMPIKVGTFYMSKLCFHCV